MEFKEQNEQSKKKTNQVDKPIKLNKKKVYIATEYYSVIKNEEILPPEGIILSEIGQKKTNTV